MDTASQLTYLLDLAEELGISVRRMPSAGDASDHPGGALVRVRGAEMLFLDPSAALADQLDAVAAALRTHEELAERYLPPEIRELLEPDG